MTNDPNKVLAGIRSDFCTTLLLAVVDLGKTLKVANGVAEAMEFPEAQRKQLHVLIDDVARLRIEMLELSGTLVPESPPPSFRLV